MFWDGGRKPRPTVFGPCEETKAPRINTHRKDAYCLTWGSNPQLYYPCSQHVPREAIKGNCNSLFKFHAVLKIRIKAFSTQSSWVKCKPAQGWGGRGWNLLAVGQQYYQICHCAVFKIQVSADTYSQ